MYINFQSSENQEERSEEMYEIYVGQYLGGIVMRVRVYTGGEAAGRQ